MPRYGESRYGQFRYGKYEWTRSGGGSGAIGEHVQYRIRFRANGSATSFLRMVRDRLAVPVPKETRFRIRANEGEWVVSDHALVQGDRRKVRIRSVDTSNSPTPWVMSERGTLTQE